LPDSAIEPFDALFTQGMVTHEIYVTRDERDRPVYHMPGDIEWHESGARLGATADPVEIIPSAKMSKSKKNVVDPSDIIERYGADTARWFVLSDSPPERDVEWTASGAEAAYKHLARVHRLASEALDAPATGDGSKDLRRAMHRTIHDVTMGIESFGFNAAIAKLYAFTNVIGKSKADHAARTEAVRTLAKLMSPMTPHLSEEIWSTLGGEGLVTTAPWPVADESYLVEDTVTLPIQINGKRRDEITVAKDLGQKEVEALVLECDVVQRALNGGTPKKLIVVPGRIVNVVV
jgi:leucyl-tRNA synthetase